MCFWRFLACAAGTFMLIGTVAKAVEIKRLEIDMFTDQDDKDEDEYITITVYRGDRQQMTIVGKADFGNGKDNKPMLWKDQNANFPEQKNILMLTLDKRINSDDLREYRLLVQKSIAKGEGSPGKGWHFYIRGVTGNDGDVKVRGPAQDVFLGHRSAFSKIETKSQGKINHQDPPEWEFRLSE